jgi:hypothetical protein
MSIDKYTNVHDAMPETCKDCKYQNITGGFDNCSHITVVEDDDKLHCDVWNLRFIISKDETNKWLLTHINTMVKACGVFMQKVNKLDGVEG